MQLFKVLRPNGRSQNGGDKVRLVAWQDYGISDLFGFSEAIHVGLEGVVAGASIIDGAVSSYTVVFTLDGEAAEILCWPEELEAVDGEVTMSGTPA